MSLNIHPIPAFTDNYLWTIVDAKKKIAIVIDPGDAEPVLDYLTKNEIKLSAILITHHHADHIGGVDKLVQKFNVPVYGPAHEKIPHCQFPLSEGDDVDLNEFGLHFKVIDVPGHTAGHIAYYGHGWLFCGDTLFAGGCGRLFEGSPQQMYDSLSKLAALPSDTLVFCTHEYTQANLKFAASVEPNNPNLIKRIDEVNRLRAEQKITLPSTIELELKTNPFLRSDSPELIAEVTKKVELNSSQPVDIFTATRELKDNF